MVILILQLFNSWEMLPTPNYTSVFQNINSCANELFPAGFVGRGLTNDQNDNTLLTLPKDFESCKEMRKEDMQCINCSLQNGTFPNLTLYMPFHPFMITEKIMCKIK